MFAIFGGWGLLLLNSSMAAFMSIRMSLFTWSRLKPVSLSVVIAELLRELNDLLGVHVVRLGDINKLVIMIFALMIPRYN